MNTDSKETARGKVIKFGTDQLNNPTPVKLKIVFRAILYLAALWAIASPMVTEIPAPMLAIINKYLLLAVALVNGTIKFFGYDYPDAK